MRKRKGEDPEDNSNPSSIHQPPPPRQALIAASQPLRANRSQKRVRKGEDPEYNSDPSSSHQPPPSQQALIAASQPLPGNSSRKRVRKARPSLQIRQQHSEGDLAVATSLDEDIEMVEASVRRKNLSPPPPPPQSLPPPSKIHVSRSCDLLTPDPLDAIRHLSIAPEQSRATPPPIYPTMFDTPSNREELEQHMKVVAAQIKEQDAATAEALQTFSAESQKGAGLAHYWEYLQKCQAYIDHYNK
jgi:hypothetical protein